MKEIDIMKNRFETLKVNGIDTGRYFTLTVNETIPAGTTINISIEGNEVANKIIEDGSFSPTSGEKVEKGYTGYVNEGDSIIFEYSKDGSVDSGDDCGYFKNMTISYIGTNVTYLALK